MLKPAVLYKEILEKKFAEIMYDDDYFLYMGYAYGHELPKIEPQDNIYQWAIVTPKKEVNTDEYGNAINVSERVIGWFAYRIQPETDTVYNFGLYSFDKGNPIVGYDIFAKMEELAKKYHRIEWRAISGNPVIRSYDKFVGDHNGNKVILHNVTKAPDGTFRNEYIYEILNKEI